MKGKNYQKRPSSVEVLYRWLRRYYLPRINKKIDELPHEVSLLANRVDKKWSGFVVL